MTASLYRPCVGVVLLNQHGQLFLAQRVSDNAPQDMRYSWQFPQGGIDTGEDPYKAALRELYEETSVQSVKYLTEYPELLRYDLPDELRKVLWKGRYAGQEQRWYMFLFVGEDSEINIHTTHPEFVTWQWSSADDIMDRIVPFKRDIYQKIIPHFMDHWKKICGL